MDKTLMLSNLVTQESLDPKRYKVQKKEDQQLI